MLPRGSAKHGASDGAATGSPSLPPATLGPGPAWENFYGPLEFCTHSLPLTGPTIIPTTVFPLYACPCEKESFGRVEVLFTTLFPPLKKLLAHSGCSVWVSVLEGPLSNTPKNLDFGGGDEIKTAGREPD